jgi:hypothetical protein
MSCESDWDIEYNNNISMSYSQPQFGRPFSRDFEATDNLTPPV